MGVGGEEGKMGAYLSERKSAGEDGGVVRCRDVVVEHLKRAAVRLSAHAFRDENTCDCGHTWMKRGG